jgi:hypothetical protein
MTPAIKELYKLAKKDTVFLDQFKDADDGPPPNFSSRNFDKIIFATVYYGWLIGNGKWEEVRSKIKPFETY